MTSAERRSKLNLYYDILVAIREESIGGQVKPTRVQHSCNMSYDKMIKYLKELENREMITSSPLEVIEKGKKFLNDYNKIREFLEEMKIEYLQEEKIIEN